MVFDINDKVAIVTGGASGIGLEYVKELLRNGCRGVTIADMNDEFARTAMENISQEFGPGKAIYINCDVTKKEQFESVFLKTIAKFKNIDILINNAGILNDAIWEKEIEINVNGTIYGVLLAMEKFMPKYKSGDEGLIINIASTAAVRPYGFIPIYCATKHAVLGMVDAWSDPELYEKTRVRIIAACPGVTNTPLIFDMPGRNLGGKYEEWLQKRSDAFVTQAPEFVAKEMMKLVKHAPTGTVWVIEGGETAYRYVIPPLESMKKNVIC